MTTLLHRVRCDRKAKPYWLVIPDDERAAIERAVPPDCYLSIMATNANPPYSVRVLRTTPDPGVNVLVAVRRGYTVASTAMAAIEAV